MYLVIEVDSEETAEETLAEVLRLVEEGNNQGYYPRWYFSEDKSDPMDPATA